MKQSLFIQKDSSLHRLHPVTKLMGVLAVFVAIVIVDHPYFLLPSFALVLLLGWLCGAQSNFKRFWKFILLISVLTAILWTAYLKQISEESLLFVTGMLLRIDAMLLAGLVFVSCTRVEELMYGLRRLGIPDRGALALGLAFRFVPTLTGVAATVLAAQRLRGLDLESGNPLQRVKKYLPLLVTVLLCAIRNAEQLSMALEGRAFGATPKRTWLQAHQNAPRDIIGAIFLVFWLASVIYLRAIGMGVIQTLQK